MPKAPLNTRVTNAIALTKEEQDADLPRIEKQIAAMVPQFELAVPAGMDPGQLARDMINLVRRQPKLAISEPNSVLGAFMTSAQLGLRPGIGALGQADILPFWNKKLERPDGRKGGYEATFVIGYQGMIELGNRTGQIRSIASRCVYHGEEFDVEYGSEQHIHHKPVMDGLPGELRGFYSRIELVNGGVLMEYWTLAQMEHHRDRFAFGPNERGHDRRPVAGPFQRNGTQDHDPAGVPVHAPANRAGRGHGGRRIHPAGSGAGRAGEPDRRR